MANIMITHSGGKQELTTTEEAIKKYRLTPKKIELAIRTGRHLKTMLFREIK